ncbi:unnamed protein product [Miscanthus lutarioriparius]|uniref:F-box domain-containing protein n=1 Tax=Miscanthus lutarioriparius TaxID=422564 RepID=A0A811QBU8_9POAL|nr:unnamed protein product [Miscanthus lutarioriparius]
MSQRSEAARSKRKTADGSTDRLSGLPEGLLLDLLSFLPSRDAVRTCVLARRWCNLWKEVPALRITPATTSGYCGASTLNRFVNDLLFFCNRLPLHVAEFSSYGGDNFDEAVQYLELWIHYSLSCPVAKLSVTSHDKYQRWLLPKGLITSEHLTALQLTRVKTQDDLDFSSCVSLKHLKMTDCGIYCDRIMSPSLKRLMIAQCHFIGYARTQIYASNLILLLLVDCMGMTPLLFIFRKDLTRCPVFSKLKTLLLNEWCITNNLGALICFLQHSPVLEKLIIQFEPPEIHERLVEIGGSYDLRKQSLVLKDLNVEVRCDDGDERVHKVLDVLGSYGLSPEKFKIQRPPILTRARFDDTWTSGKFQSAASEFRSEFQISDQLQMSTTLLLFGQLFSGSDS